MDSLTHFTHFTHFTSLTSLTSLTINFCRVDPLRATQRRRLTFVESTPYGLPSVDDQTVRSRRYWRTQGLTHWRLVWPGFFYTASAIRVRARALRALAKKSTKKFPKRASSPAKSEVLQKKKCLFYLKRPPSPAKNSSVAWKNDKKLTKNWPKNPSSPAKTWSFEWKFENRPTYGDFEKKNLDPQLQQTFKPITLLFCTTSSCSDLS